MWATDLDTKILNSQLKDLVVFSFTIMAKLGAFERKDRLYIDGIIGRT